MALVEFEEHVEKWSSGLISDDELRSVANNLGITNSLIAETMHSEQCDLSAETIEKLKDARILV